MYGLEAGTKDCGLGGSRHMLTMRVATRLFGLEEASRRNA